MECAQIAGHYLMIPCRVKRILVSLERLEALESDGQVGGHFDLFHVLKKVFKQRFSLFFPPSFVVNWIVVCSFSFSGVTPISHNSQSRQETK